MQFYTLVATLYIFHLTSGIDEFYFKDLRREFLERRTEKRKQDIRLKILDRISNFTTITFEGIPHVLENENEIENAFKQTLTMQEAKYIYKRDLFWRTWRDVEIGGKREIVHYKCSNMIRDNGTRCDGGFWILEEKPPQCPYEIFSINSTNDVCVFQFNSTFSDCSIRISRRELRSVCDNYIETLWRITKKWQLKGEYTAIICQGREFCDITTLYIILPDSIVFRIINSTDHIIFSKIMKSDNKNYICVNNCGKYDSITKKVVDNDEPLSLSLLNNKKKREEMYGESPKTSNLLSNGLHYYYESKEKSAEKKPAKKTSSCSKIREKYIRDENLSEYWYN